MTIQLPPPPYGAEKDDYMWLDWYNLYREQLQDTSNTVDLLTTEGVGIPNGATNPASGTEGALFFNSTDGKLYRYYSGAWTAAVPTVDLTGQITTTQITDAAVSTPKLAALAVEAGNIAANAVTSDKIIANAITAGKIAASAVETDKIAANAVTASKISVTNLATINAELGSAVISTTGSLRSGQTAYDTGTGWWIGYDAGVPKFSIGVSGGNRLTFDGTTLEVTLDSSAITQTGVQQSVNTGIGATVTGASGTATATQYFYDDGTLRYQQNAGTVTNNGNWYTPTTTGIGSSYWIKYTKISNVLETPTGTFNEWLAMSSATSVELARTSIGEAEAVIKFDISSDSSGSPIVGSGFITLYAIREA